MFWSGPAFVVKAVALLEARIYSFILNLNRKIGKSIIYSDSFRGAHAFHEAGSFFRLQKSILAIIYFRLIKKPSGLRMHLFKKRDFHG